MEISSCDICGAQMSKPFIKYDFKAFPCRVSICMNDGLVKLNPRWQESKYEWFYFKKYDFFYRGPNMKIEKLFEIDLKSHKGQKMKERLQNMVLPDKLKMLDVGAGTGFSFFSLPENVKVEPYAIEASEKCIPFLKQKGITIVGTDFSCDFFGSYDLIVARHALEHTLNPIGFLTKIRNSLNEEGYLYLVVPNAMKFNEKKANGFFRHIHTYYFNIKTLLQICQKAGLYAVIAGDEGEVWAILQRRVTNYLIPEDISPIDQLTVIKKMVNYNRFPLKSRIRAVLKRVYYRAF